MSRQEAPTRHLYLLRRKMKGYGNLHHKKHTGEEFTGLLEHHTEALQTHPIKSRSRRKYVFTNQIDELIRAIYLDRPGAKTRPGIRLLAKKVGIPHWALKKRARE